MKTVLLDSSLRPWPVRSQKDVGLGLGHGVGPGCPAEERLANGALQVELRRGRGLERNGAVFVGVS